MPQLIILGNLKPPLELAVQTAVRRAAEHHWPILCDRMLTLEVAREMHVSSESPEPATFTLLTEDPSAQKMLGQCSDGTAFLLLGNEGRFTALYAESVPLRFEEPPWRLLQVTEGPPRPEVLDKRVRQINVSTIAADLEVVDPCYWLCTENLRIADVDYSRAGLRKRKVPMPA